MLKMGDDDTIDPADLPSGLGLGGFGMVDIFVEFLEEVVVCLET